ncbi:hypothetical protein CASFOL_024813 [Castilleja foliolosa]|uniref:Protein kinase domain-containing protein n=1 Tax=Castilleja foliolosa TaxID=1961234 RepID=A0ABD3CQM6_9LAMI
MYLSPESVKGYEQEAASDIWAVGCVVIKMFTRNRPWKGAKEEILKRIGEGIELPEIPEWISEDARDFVMLCFEREPGKRLSADVLLDHPFLECSCNGYDDRYVVEEFEDYEFRSNRWIPEDWELSSCKNPKVFDYLGAALPIAAGF